MRVSDNGKRWIPDHPEIPQDVVDYAYPTDTPIEEVRAALFRTVDEMYPGLFQLNKDLEELRGEVLAQIDVRSDALLRSFTFEGIVFSLSVNAQIRYEYMDRKAEQLPYPLPINSLDDRDMLILTSPEHTHAFCHQSTVHVMTVVMSGTMQKDIIRAATTVEELENYTDPR
jgi:hypothetical protein